MVGNLAELTEDCWMGDYDGAPVDGSAWVPAWCGDEHNHLRRSLGFTTSASRLRLAFRSPWGPGPSFDLGGRCARSLP